MPSKKAEIQVQASYQRSVLDFSFFCLAHLYLTHLCPAHFLSFSSQKSFPPFLSLADVLFLNLQVTQVTFVDFTDVDYKSLLPWICLRDISITNLPFEKHIPYCQIDQKERQKKKCVIEFT